jgi:hypothetical protein
MKRLLPKHSSLRKHQMLVAESTKFDDDEKDTTNTMSYFASLAAEEE